MTSRMERIFKEKLPARPVHRRCIKQEKEIILMNRRIVTLMVFCMALSFFENPAVTAQNQLKMAYVRSGYILSNFEPYRKAVKAYEEFERVEVEKLQKRAADFQKKVADSQKQAAFMTEEKVRDLSRQLEQENAELEKYSEQLYNRENGILAKKYQELIKPIFDRVNKTIFQIRTEGGYAFIFEAESDALIDADEKYDISDKVIEQLNKSISEKPKQE